MQVIPYSLVKRIKSMPSSHNTVSNLGDRLIRFAKDWRDWQVSSWLAGTHAPFALGRSFVIGCEGAIHPAPMSFVQRTIFNVTHAVWRALKRNM